MTTYTVENIYKRFQESFRRNPQQYVWVMFTKIYKTKIRPSRAGEKVDMILKEVDGNKLEMIEDKYWFWFLIIN